jgi:hypothetical protein
MTQTSTADAGFRTAIATGKPLQMVDACALPHAAD